MNEPVKISLLADLVRVPFDQSRLLFCLTDAMPGTPFQIDLLSEQPERMRKRPHVILSAIDGRGRPDWYMLVARRWSSVPIVGLVHSDHQEGLLSCLPPELSDFVFCPVDERELALRIQRVLSWQQSGDPDETAARRVRIESLVGDSPSFQAQVGKVPLFAGADATVLLQGETGTGKELFARAIHYRSDRKDKAFIPVNCAALPDQLFENELFGHVKGAYTSAAREQAGLVLEAEGGTLFLDEVDALSPFAQAKLLRFVQYREYRPLGCGRSRVANIRILAASNQDLRQAVAARHFREDLFHRLNVLSLVIPPLRERVDDIPLLAQRFLQRYRKTAESTPRLLSPAALDKLLTHTWPGNVRELECTLQRAVVLSGAPMIDAGDIDFAVEPARARELTGSLRDAKNSAAMDVERAYLVKTLVTFRGNVTHAARAAGKERRSFQRLLRKYGIDRQMFQSDSTTADEATPARWVPAPLDNAH
jgi:DNA-binding NtrC family response regulator